MRFVRALLICSCFFALAFGPTIANAQTFVNQQTTTTLWAGSQDVTQFGLTGLTAPSSGLILQGTAISAFTGKPVRHLWYGDLINGLCRIDPEIDSPIATPQNGIGSFNVNLLTCLSSIQNAPFSPGALTFDVSSNNIYTEDTGRTTAGILRAHYIPSGDNGQGSLDLVHVDSLVGTQSTRNAFGGCPQLTDPKTGILVPFVPNSAAIGPDGNLYTGSVHDGAILRIIGPASFNPTTDCVNPGDTGQNPNAKLQIPILSADERVGSGRTFGLGWIGHTLFGADDIAPWILFNADQCLTPVNGNKICAAPVLGGAAPMGVEILAAQVAMPRGGAASDAVFPSYSGKVIYFATVPSVTRITNVATSTNMTANLNYGGSFSFISGLTPDPADLNNAMVYVAADPTQGDISGAGQIWKVTTGPLPPGPPATPVLQSDVAGPGTGQATVTWAAVQNGQPISTYTVQTLLASTTGGAPVPSAIPNVTANAPITSATIGGLTVGTAYVFEVEACNTTGCSALSAASSPVTALAFTAPAAPSNVTAVDGGNGASAGITWTLSSNGNSPILNSTIITNAPAGASPVANTVVPGSGSGGVVAGLSCGQSYTFQVFATNAMGNSQTSAPSAPLSIACVSAADVSATESAPATVNAGSQATFTISIKNNGPASAPSVMFSNTLPAPLVSSSATQGVCTTAPGATAFNCSLGPMAPASAATVAVTVQLPANQTSGSFTNTVTVNATNAGGTNIDPNLTNNTASATVSISNPCATSTTDIQTTGSAQTGNPIHGTPDVFTWQIKNNQGSVAANCVTFSATTTAPAGATLAFNSASSTIGTCSILNNAVSCNIGTIPGGQTAIVSVSATPSSAGAANSYAMTGRAQLGPGSTDTNSANNSFTVLIGAQ